MPPTTFYGNQKQPLSYVSFREDNITGLWHRHFQKRSLDINVEIQGPDLEAAQQAILEWNQVGWNGTMNFGS